MTTLSGFAALPTRDIDIVRLVAGGLSDEKIAGRLYVDEATVQARIAAIMEQVDVTQRTHLGILYLEC